ncbi:MAG TPA: type IV toxin-antitoxin system AbiEi family antitoxin domain-containing protein [Actinomycetes bacterium]|nr:type IV toxin-antitoxin system AbiEi family antitoxin domain-containing protein [Actinomycetes bacterium]
MSLRTRDLLDAVSWIAQDQSGLITAAQLAEIGVIRSTLSRRIRSGGQWRRVLPGVYQVTEGALSLDQRDQAGLLFAGKGGVLTGSPGLRRHGIRYLPEPPETANVHVAIPIQRHRKSAGFVTVERTQRPPAPLSIDGFPVASIARSLVDAGRRIVDRRSTRAFVLEAIQRELTNIEQIDRELRRAQRRGTALLRDTLDEARAGVRSAPEAELRAHMLRAKMPAALWNPSLLLPNGAFLAQPDGLIEESMTVLEVQSEEYHSTGRQWRETLQRASIYSAHGLLVVHIVPADMRRNPAMTLRLIGETHREGLNRPRPHVFVEDTRGTGLPR